MQNKTTNIRKLTGTAMLGAVAAVLMYMEFPIPIMPSFVKLDVSELPALLAAYAYGPVSGIAVCLIKNLIKLPSTSTAAVGELFNFVMGALFVGVAGFVYKRSKTRRSALIGAGLGALAMAVVSVPYNYFIVYLDKSEIDRMVKEAAAHEAEDKKRKEAIEAKNNADSLIYQAEKTIKDLGDKADASKVSEIKSKIADLKEAVKTNDVDKIKAASEALTKPLYDLTSDMYKQADTQQQAAQQQAGAQQSAGAQQQENQNGEKVVDADYKVVDDDQK